jgi:hypothetical protein
MAEVHECKMVDKIKYIEKDIKELKDNNREHSKDMANLKESHLETKIYVKQIFESLTNLTATMKGLTEKPSKRWDQVITTIITVAVTMGATYFFIR